MSTEAYFKSKVNKSLKNQISVKELNVPLFPGKVEVIQTNDFKSVIKKYKLQNMEGIEACAFRIEKKGIAKYYMLFNTEVNASVIAHECAHIVNYIFDDVFIKLDVDNDETQCYLLGWLVGECHKFLNGIKSK